MEKRLVLVPFGEEDIGELTAIMKRAFDEDTRLHLGEAEGGPEGYADGSFLRKWGLESDSRQYKVLLDGKVVGGVILWTNEESGENYLGNIFLDTSLQNQGIGAALWRSVEELYPATRVWRTDTPGFSRRNHHFYVNKCGFHVVHIENPMDLRHCSYFFEKRMPLPDGK